MKGKKLNYEFNIQYSVPKELYSVALLTKTLQYTWVGFELR